MRLVLTVLAAVLLLAIPGLQAQQPGGAPPSIGPDPVITNGTFSVGIGANGELYDPVTGVGFRRLSDGYDPLQPGTPRDSWGVTANGHSAYADQSDFGTVGITSSTYNAGAQTETTTTSSAGTNLTVVQTYSLVAPNMLIITEKITNNAATATDILFQRNIDWDVAPTEFNETSSGPAITGNVIQSTFNGFQNPNPSVAYGDSCAAGCSNTGDNGGGIKLDLGTVAAGASTTFQYLYGINKTGETQAGLISQAQGLGAYYYIATESSDTAHTNSAIIAVVTPEPGSWALLLTAVAGVALKLRRRSQVS